MYTLTLNDGNDALTFAPVSGATRNTPAVWVHSNSVPALSKQISLSVADNKARTARKARVAFVNPAVNALCSDSCELHNIPVSIDITFPNVVSQADRDAAIELLSALMSNSDVKASLKAGFAPA